MRYRLRTLLIVLALGPPVIGLAWRYGKVALGLLALTLLFCPDLLILVGQGAWAHADWVRKSKRAQREGTRPTTDNRNGG
jgi:hypothetical protein